MNRILHLESLEKLGWRFGLETIHALLSELGDPQLSLKVIHVAGSNGKGSTCAFIASFLKLSGYKTGLYTSPHLSEIRERFRINGTWISKRDFSRHTRNVLSACQRVSKKLGHLPTHFEALTAIAFCWFREQKVDWVVLEVGLGGRLDATNVILSPAICLITPVSLEHQNILGKKIEKIAWEKAGIFKQGCLGATVQYHGGAATAIDRVAKEKGVRLWMSGREFSFKKRPKGFYWEGPGLKTELKVPYLADYQIVNAALAVAGIQALKFHGLHSTPLMVQKSLTAMHWPGRLETLSQNPLVVLDGAHNPDAAVAMAGSLKKYYPHRRWIVLNGFLKDKNFTECIHALKEITTLSIVTEPPNERKIDGPEIFYDWEKQGVPTVFIKNWREALGFSLSKLNPKDKDVSLLIMGSLYLTGACRRQLIGLKGLKNI